MLKKIYGEMKWNSFILIFFVQIVIAIGVPVLLWRYKVIDIQSLFLVISIFFQVLYIMNIIYDYIRLNSFFERDFFHHLIQDSQVKEKSITGYSIDDLEFKINLKFDAIAHKEPKENASLEKKYQVLHDNFVNLQKSFHKRLNTVKEDLHKIQDDGNQQFLELKIQNQEIVKSIKYISFGVKDKPFFNLILLLLSILAIVIDIFI